MVEVQYAPTRLAGQAFAPPARPAPARPPVRRRMDIHDAMAFVSILLVVVMGDNLRAAGGIIYFGSVGLATLSLGRGIPRKTARDAAIFGTIVLVYCVLSYAHLLPRGWTVFYQRGDIARQALPLIGFCVMLVAYHRFWGRMLTGKFDDKRLWWVMAALFLVGPLVDVAFGRYLSIPVASTLRNASLVFVTISAYMAWSRRGALLTLMPLFYVILAVLTSYSQTRGFYLISAVLLWAYAAKLNFSRHMVLAIVFVVTVATTYVLLTFDRRDYLQLYYTDFNTAWRLLFWRDVFRSTGMTFGMGVGFGTEALVNVYPGMPRPIFILNPADNPDFIMTGTHNAFTDALFRCGLPGFLMLIWIFLSSARILRRRYSPAVAISFCGAFLCAFVNVALQSPLYSVGIAFALGLCRAMHAADPKKVAEIPQASPELPPAAARENVT